MHSVVRGQARALETPVSSPSGVRQYTDILLDFPQDPLLSSRIRSTQEYRLVPVFKNKCPHRGSLRVRHTCYCQFWNFYRDNICRRFISWIREGKAPTAKSFLVFYGHQIASPGASLVEVRSRIDRHFLERFLT